MRIATEVEFTPTPTEAYPVHRRLQSHSKKPTPIKKPATRTGFFKEYGGAMRDRTADLLHAMQALSQLSYSPDVSVTST